MVLTRIRYDSLAERAPQHCRKRSVELPNYQRKLARKRFTLVNEQAANGMHQEEDHSKRMVWQEEGSAKLGNII